MTKITFNHEEDKLTKALNLSDSQVEELSEKVSTMCNNLLHKHHKQSMLAEEIANELSYKELLLLATISLVEKTEQWIADNPLAILKGIVRQMKEESNDNQNPENEMD
jgi:hypothetical protein